MDSMMLYWIFFTLLIVIFFACDLLLFHNKTISLKKSLFLTSLWIFMTCLFGIFIYFTKGKEHTINFFSGYLIEKALSIDNLFVFIVIFEQFKTPQKYIHKVLIWGIIGAILLRALFIALGVTLIAHFHEIIYLLGAFLVYSGIALFVKKEKKILKLESRWWHLLKKYIRITKDYRNGHFFIRDKGILFATPLFLTLIVIECTDIIFALDSIPAIFAITLDPFIVFSSNIFAILGLRALFFSLSHLINYFHYLHQGVSLILILAGVKMLLSGYYHIPIFVSLLSIFLILSLSIIASLIFPKKNSGLPD